jgi:hypothetical protein
MLKYPFLESCVNMCTFDVFRDLGRSSGSPKDVRALIIVAAFLLFSLTSDADLLQGPLISGEARLCFVVCF